MTGETINLAALQRLLNAIGGDPEDLTELLEDYVSGAPALVTRMRDGARSANWVAVFQAAHTLKSNALDMGATHLSALCAALESEAREQPVDAAEERIAEIAAEEEIVRQALMEIQVRDIGCD